MRALRITGPLAVAAVLLTGLTPMAVARPALRVVPFPGTPDASPGSEVIFSALRRSDLAGVPVVSGSSSGAHGGRLVSLPDGGGVAFVPGRPFVEGETVSVRAGLTSAAAGTASGDPGARSLSFSFGIAVSAGRQAAAGAGSPQPSPSQPGLNPPPVHLATGAAPGSRNIFLSPHVWGNSPYQSGVMILDPRGRVLWFRPQSRGTDFNLEVQHYRGRPVLTWWQGLVVHHGTRHGRAVILDGSYRRVAVLRAAYGYSSDLHEFQITPSGRALIAASVPVRVDLSGVGGPVDGWLNDCVIQELAIPSGRLLWEWHALGHVPLSASMPPRLDGSEYLYFHFNSAQQLPDHRLLISSRNTWSAYEIDELTGKVIWTLGGRYSSFKMGPGTGFEWQHDPHLYGHGLLSVFDDGASPQQERQSSAKELKLNYRTHTVSLLKRFTHTPPLLATAEGSAQILGNRDMFVGWGDTTSFSEYSPGGKQIFNATFPLGTNSYRAYRFPWTGRPSTPPTLTQSKGKHGVLWLHASWNGATQIARWRILAGPTPHTLRPLTSKSWTGLKTTIPIPHPPHYLKAQALNSQGQTIAHTPTSKSL